MWKNLTDGVLISPSIIATDLTLLGERVAAFDPGLIDLLHMDVMDGRFVPNLTFGPGYMGYLKEHTSIPFDVHLMIEAPEQSLEQYLALKPWGVTIHYEAARFPARLLEEIRDAGIIAGISLNPATPVEALFDLLPFADMVLVMSVEPGFYGQSFMKPALRRIESLFDRINSEGLAGKIVLSVDGGITLENISGVVQAGARIIVAGGSAFKNGDLNGNVKALKRRAGKAR